MIKKIIAALSAVLCIGAAASAENIPIEFHKYGGGQFIYCNNPEYLSEADLSSDENPTPTYMMKNENLKPDNYSVFFCFYNWTDFAIEPDIEFVSEDAVITINSIGYYIPQDHEYWDCLGAWSDYLGINIHTLDSKQYVPYQNIDLPKTFSLKDGREWISKFIYNYKPVSSKVTFNMLVDFTIEEGSADVNFTALKNYGAAGDRTHHDENASRGKYLNDTTIKGIEKESLPITECDLNIDIDAAVKNGERMPVEVYNQYFPKGTGSDCWMTNINPSRDGFLYSKGVASSSDMLTFEYEDDNKTEYYGEDITERDNIFLFDIFHYNTLEYEDGMPWKQSEHIPNAAMDKTLSIKKLPDTRWQFNLGNFGVTNRYNITVTNSDTVPRSLNFMLETSHSSNIAIIRDENGNMLNPYTLTTENPFAVAKAIHEDKTEDCMMSVMVSPGETLKYTLDIILPTNCYGGIINYLIADNHTYLKEQTLCDFSEYTEYHDYKSTFFNGENLMKWENGQLFEYIDGDWHEIELPESAQEIFSANTQDIKITKTPSGYAARFAAWDEYGYSIKDTVTAHKIYLFDNDFEYLYDVQFDEFVKNMVYANGLTYAETGDYQKFISYDGLSFKRLKSDYDMPVTNGKYSILKTGNEFFMTDGRGASKLEFYKKAPSEIYSAGGIFYRILSWKNFDFDTDTGNVLAVSADGVNWVEVFLPNRLLTLKNIEYRDNTLYVYTKYETLVFNDIIPKDNIKVNLDNEYLIFDVGAKVVNSRTMVPLRAIFEKLDARVEWDNEARQIHIESDDTDMVFTIDSDIALLNGEEVKIDAPPIIDNSRTLIPIRFLAENLGYTVSWEQETQTAFITSEQLN